jgi:transposase
VTTRVGGKTRTNREGQTAKAWDHDPPAKRKVTPFGVLVLLTGVLTLVFGEGGSSDFWVDALQVWWRGSRSMYRRVKRLVIYLDNGPENSGRRTQFLKRMVQFADWSGLVIRLVYYPPYHSKYNPIERCWSALAKKWNGVLLNCWEVILACAARMRWRRMRPRIARLPGVYSSKVRVSAGEMKQYEDRLERSTTLPYYDITIRPRKPRGG